jgi:hypothetical protein
MEVSYGSKCEQLTTSKSSPLWLGERTLSSRTTTSPKGHKQTSVGSLDHIVGERQQLFRHYEAERPPLVGALALNGASAPDLLL